MGKLIAVFFGIAFVIAFAITIGDNLDVDYVAGGIGFVLGVVTTVTVHGLAKAPREIDRTARYIFSLDEEAAAKSAARAARNQERELRKWAAKMRRDEAIDVDWRSIDSRAVVPVKSKEVQPYE